MVKLSLRADLLSLPKGSKGQRVGQSTKHQERIPTE